jgi:hypothetical protein
MSPKSRNIFGTLLGACSGLFTSFACFGVGLAARNGQGFEIFLPYIAFLLVAAAIASVLVAACRVRLLFVILSAYLVFPLLFRLFADRWFVVHLSCLSAEALGILIGAFIQHCFTSHEQQPMA